jgi:hypothetical protein
LRIELLQWWRDYYPFVKEQHRKSDLIVSFSLHKVMKINQFCPEPGFGRRFLTPPVAEKTRLLRQAVEPIDDRLVLRAAR